MLRIFEVYFIYFHHSQIERSGEDFENQIWSFTTIVLAKLAD